MRIGHNPNKNIYSKESEYVHQVVIPVYIPELNGYFKDSFEILKMCLESLEKTSDSNTFLTIVNNGSCLEVSSYLNKIFQKKIIHEVIHSKNIGKINAVIKGVVGHDIPFVTISDADVLFLTGWQEEAYKIFKTFPKAGVVGFTPQFKLYENYSGNVIWENFFSRKLRFTKVTDKHALQKFYQSIGWDNSYNKDYLDRHLTITSKNCRAVIGSGHYVATYRRSLFKTIISYQNAKLGLNSEKELDIIPLKKGYWRLTTDANFAHHMGNVKEDWMNHVLESLENRKDTNILLPDDPNQSESRISYFVKNRVLPKIFSYNFTKQFFYSLKGLPKQMRSKY